MVRLTLKSLSFILLVVLPLSNGVASADDRGTLVEFEKLGQRFNAKALSPKQRSVLKKAGIAEDYADTFDEPLPRVAGVAGLPGKYVFAHSCASAADGTSSECVLQAIVSLDTGNSIDLPAGGDPLMISFVERNGTMGNTRILVNDRRELTAIVYVGSYVKKLRGKQKCTNKGAVMSIDPKALSLSVVASNWPLGGECYAPSQQAQQDPKKNEQEFDAYFQRLSEQALNGILRK